MNDTILSLSFTAFFLIGTIVTVVFLACLVVDEAKRGAGK